LLLIGSHGSAQTLASKKVPEVLGNAFPVSDAKVTVENILGYPNVGKLKEGVVEYVPSQVTVWDEETFDAEASEYGSLIEVLAVFEVQHFDLSDPRAEVCSKDATRGKTGEAGSQ
jgi:hypothetical protein